MACFRSAVPRLSLRAGISQGCRTRNWFRKIAENASHLVGTQWAFLVAAQMVASWALTGPYFGYSDTWQLFINTGTTIITFLMVFLIQNTQNRETRVMILKLDELIRAAEGARTGFVELDHMTEGELEAVQEEFHRLRGRYAPLLDDGLAHVERTLVRRRGDRG